MSGGVVYYCVQMLEHAAAMSSIVGDLAVASEQVDVARSLLGGGAYQGSALDEMVLFYDSYLAHIDKLALFYMAGQRFLIDAVGELADTEEKLAAVVDAWLEIPR